MRLVPSLRMFEIRVLRTVFGPKRGDITEDWRRLHCDELRYFLSSPNIILMII